MADWESYLNTTARTVSIADAARLLHDVVGVETTRETGERQGNPMDYYHYKVTLTASRPDVEVVLELTDNDNPAPTTTVDRLKLRGTAPFSTKYALWRAALDALAALGVRADGAARSAMPLIVEAEAAGEMAVAKQLRVEASALAIADAKTATSVSIWQQRFDDLDAVLAAYDPPAITSVSLYDCELRGIPAAIARFQNLEQLTLYEPTIDGAALRALSLPKLTMLSICDTGVRELQRDDLAGFPLLSLLYVCRTPLTDVDPTIIDVCPALKHVVVTDTPLDANAAKHAALRERWPNVVWEPPPSAW